jgi:hypothetical protein
MAVHAEGALDSSEAGAFLGGVEDDVFFSLAVTVRSGLFAVLFAALEATVALPSVFDVTVAFEVVAAAVGAGQGDRLGDWHRSILT